MQVSDHFFCEAYDLVQAHYSGLWEGDDNSIDSVLRINRDCERNIKLSSQLLKLGQNRLEYGDMSYDIVRAIYKYFNPRPNELLVDIGCGYGRILLYGTVLRGQLGHGIEILEYRAKQITKSIQELGLKNISLRTGNALLLPLPKEAKYFCLMNSLLLDQLPEIIKRLKKVARKKKIYIISISTTSTILNNQKWLEQLSVPTPKLEALNLEMFQSI